MSIRVIPKERQGYGQFNGGQIIENKPIGFPRDGGEVQPYSNLFYWAYAEAKEESTIGLHPHQGFEIMSFVLRGAIRHYDTSLKEWRGLKEGDAQIIRAGNGISHAEHMEKDAVMFQIWMDPNLDKTLQQAASYDDYADEDFPKQSVDGLEVKTYVGADAPMTMDAPDVQIMEYAFDSGCYNVAISETLVYSIYVLEGSVLLNEAIAEQDAFAVLSENASLKIESITGGKLFVIASPKTLQYKTYQQMMQGRV